MIPCRLRYTNSAVHYLFPHKESPKITRERDGSVEDVRETQSQDRSNGNDLRQSGKKQVSII